MSESKSGGASGGIGFLGVLTIVFITLKLTGFIHWSWVWVLAPLWIPFSVVAIIATVALVVLFIRFYRQQGRAS